MSQVYLSIYKENGAKSCQIKCDALKKHDFEFRHLGKHFSFYILFHFCDAFHRCQIPNGMIMELHFLKTFSLKFGVKFWKKKKNIFHIKIALYCDFVTNCFWITNRFCFQDSKFNQILVHLRTVQVFLKNSFVDYKICKRSILSLFLHTCVHSHFHLKCEYFSDSNFLNVISKFIYCLAYLKELFF